MVSRRWYYLVPAQGEPRKLVHKIESHVLDPLPGATTQYSGWRDQQVLLPALLAGSKRVAMQYSPNCAVPYVSNIDAGTVELVRGCGVEVVTSANLIQVFEAVWSEAQYAMHKRAGTLVDAARRAAFARVSDVLRSGHHVTEYEIQQFICDTFKSSGLTYDHGPIVAVNGNASNAHYDPDRTNSSEIKRGDLLLIDLWAKLDQPGAVYYDITWTGYCGTDPADKMLNVFAAVTGARDAAVARVKSAVNEGTPLAGYQVDDACRRLPAGARPRRAFLPSHRPFHRRGSARQRRQYGQLRDPRRAHRHSGYLLFRGAWSVPSRFRYSQRSECLSGAVLGRGDWRDPDRAAAAALKALNGATARKPSRDREGSLASSLVRSPARSRERRERPPSNHLSFSVMAQI